MAFHLLRHLVAIAALNISVRGQKMSNIIPNDLQAGFSSDTQVQVSYTGEAVNGFADGTVFEKAAVSNEPAFALGDSSGISPQTLYTIIMVDTTCPSALKLHYVRANFKNNFDITNIDTKSAALQVYKAPGSFGETGDNRQYSFLMYTNPGFQLINQLKLPEQGKSFDLQKFQSENGLPDASAGVGMVVKLGGQVNCVGNQENTLPATSSTSKTISSTATQPLGVSSLTKSALSSNARSSMNVAPITSTSLSTNTANTRRPVSTISGAAFPSSLDGSLQPTDEISSGKFGASTNAPDPSTVTSTVIFSNTVPLMTGTPATSTLPGVQTANAAPRLIALQVMTTGIFGVVVIVFG